VRPINLIPPDERRRTGGVATRTGPIVYLFVGALGVILIGVVMLVLFDNSIHSHEGEVTRLESEKSTASAEASKLARFTSFNQVAEERTHTISELADSRFDWVRVVRELSLVLPRDIYLESLVASGGGGSETGITGPSMTMVGCGASQPGVGGFLTALKQIDGVTRVELDSSTVTGRASSSEGKGVGGCQRSGLAHFELLVTFDGANPSPDSSGGETVAAGAEGSTEPEGSSEESGGSSESEGVESSSTESGSTAAVGTSAGAAG
jgi:Tfp pilus assembly protein PilN